MAGKKFGRTRDLLGEEFSDPKQSNSTDYIKNQDRMQPSDETSRIPRSGYLYGDSPIEESWDPMDVVDPATAPKMLGSKIALLASKSLTPKIAAVAGPIFYNNATFRKIAGAVAKNPTLEELAAHAELKGKLPDELVSRLNELKGMFLGEKYGVSEADMASDIKNAATKSHPSVSKILSGKQFQLDSTSELPFLNSDISPNSDFKGALKSQFTSTPFHDMAYIRVPNSMSIQPTKNLNEGFENLGILNHEVAHLTDTLNNPLNHGPQMADDLTSKFLFSEDHQYIKEVLDRVPREKVPEILNLIQGINRKVVKENEYNKGRIINGKSSRARSIYSTLPYEEVMGPFREKLKLDSVKRKIDEYISPATKKMIMDTDASIKNRLHGIYGYHHLEHPELGHDAGSLINDFANPEKNDILDKTLDNQNYEKFQKLKELFAPYIEAIKKSAGN